MLATADGIDAVIAFDEVIPSTGWDYWVPLLSLPGHCNTRVDAVPATLPYLRVPAAAMKKWAIRLPAKRIDELRVGLVWKGNPLFENDTDRSQPSLDVLMPLTQVKNVRFISLQKGAGEDEVLHPPAGFHIIALGHEIGDFADTAAIVSCLDLVICVDTAVAHLAGALGKTCWVMLPTYKPDWRWLKDRADTPWYPGVMRLYRQTEMGNWNDVVTDIATQLRQQVSTLQLASEAIVEEY